MTVISEWDESGSESESVSSWSVRCSRCSGWVHGSKMSEADIVQSMRDHADAECDVWVVKGVMES